MLCTLQVQALTHTPVMSKVACLPFPAGVSFGVGFVVGVAICLLVAFSVVMLFLLYLCRCVCQLQHKLHIHTHAIKVPSLSVLCTQCTSAMLGTVITDPFDACMIYINLKLDSTS